MPANDSSERLASLTELLRQQPEVSSNWMRRGVLHAEVGLLQEALSDYDRAIELDPANAEIYFCRGNAHLACGHWQAAVTDFNSAIAKDPSHVEAMTNRGVAFERMESWSKAIESYKEALAIDPHRVVPRMNIGNVLVAMRDHQAAIAAYTDAIRRAPRAASIYVLRAKARIAQRDWEAALQDLSDASSFGAVSAEAAFLEGQAYHGLRQPDKAVAALKKATELDNCNAVAFGMLGWNELKLGRIEDAMKHTRICLKLDPANLPAQYNLQLLSAMGMDLEKLEETADAHDAPVKDEASERSPDAPKTADACILERDFGPKVPWSRLAGWVKCMRPSDFDDEQRRAFELTFAGFFEEQHTDESVIEAARHSLGGLDVKVEPAFAFRRYAGGSNLPRSRYYSVCQNSSGDDGGTLRNELCSYVDLRVSGEISVMDFTEPMLLGAKLANQDRFTRDEFPEYPLGVSFQSARGINSPWGEQLQNTRRAESGARIHMGHGFTIFLPLRVEPMTIERVIDLRLPAVQEWLAQSVFSGIPTARFIYSDSIPRATDLGEAMRLLLALSTPQLLLDPSEISKYAANSSKGNSGTPPIKGNWTDVKFYATHPDGTKNGIAGLTDNAFHNLLPLLLFHPKGGSPITEAIGEWLRSLGANALIYPSARSDIRVEIEDGAVTRFAGWNLLDYRDAPPPPRLLRLIQHPASNARTRTQLSRGLPREERLKGSFSISGIQACEWQDWVFQEELYYQAKMFADTPALYLKEWSSPTLNRTLSLADIRGLLKIGILDYSIEFTRGAAPQSRPIGQWLADYLDARIPNYTTNRVEYGEEWFFYRLEPTFEPQIICPICEYNRIWSLDRKEPVDRACPVCGYPGPHEINPDVTAVRFFELCDGL